MAVKTIYHVCVSPVGWHDPLAITAYARQVDDGINHRTVLAAVRWDARHIQRPCQRDNGPSSWIPTRVLATEDGGENYRPLTEEEMMAL